MTRPRRFRACRLIKFLLSRIREFVLKKLMMQLALVMAGGSVVGAASGADVFRPVVRGGLSYGGDDWQVGSTPANQPVLVRGGGGVEMGAGVLWQSAAYPVQASVVTNYHVDSNAGVNHSARF